MNIRYTTRSRFFASIHAAIDEHGGCPQRGRPVQVALDERGYPGEVLIEINADVNDEFSTDWYGKDDTRFPARLKAAATVLRDRGCFGRFVISHGDGLLIIAREPLA